MHRVGLGLVEGGGRRLRFTASDRDDGRASTWCDVDAYDDVPINVALRRRTMIVGALDELSGRFADYVAASAAPSTVALAAVPVEAAGRRSAATCCSTTVARPSTPLSVRSSRDLGRRARHGPAPRPARRGAPAPSSLRPTGPGLGRLGRGPRGRSEAAAVAEARRFLRRTLHDWDVDDETADTAVLCLSELVTNAVIHSHAGCSVRVRLDGGVLTVTVRDSGRADAQTVEQLEDSLQVHGRGLQVVEALASRWGYELDTEGTTVWFELEV